MQCVTCLFNLLASRLFWVKASALKDVERIGKRIMLFPILFVLLCSSTYGQDGVVHERSFMHDDSLRSYLLYVPDAYDGQADWPLIINYHGYDVDANFQMNYTGMNATADTAHFLVAYPQGLLVNNPFSGTTGPGWNLLGGTLSENDDIDFSLELINHVKADYMVDPARIHVTGWSMGAGMAYELACAHPAQIASLAAVDEQMDDGLLGSCSPGRAMSFLQIHGTADPLVPFNGAAAGGVSFSPAPLTASFYAGLNSCMDSTEIEIEDSIAGDSSTVTLTKYTSCNDDTEVLFYRINNGGHTWPGSTPIPGLEFLGHTNQDINANSEIWNFFKRNPHPDYVANGVVHERSFMHDDSLRSYLLYVPDAYDGQADWPLVIHYHGFDIDAEFQMNYSNMNATADTAHFLVAYPNGLIVEDIVFGALGPGWYIPGSYGATHDDVAFTSSLIDHINVDFQIDIARVHATGWSNGGEFSYYLAAMLPDRIASIASVSNGMNETSFSTYQLKRPFSSMLIHGTADPFFPPEGVPGAFPPHHLTPAFWASQNNCSPDSIVTELPDIVAGDSSIVTLIEYQNCDPGTETAFYRIADGGHTWPGSTPIPGLEWLGHTNQDIDANSVIWNFFKRNPHPEITTGVATYDKNAPSTFRMSQNYPNPFNPSTTIEFSLPQSSFVSLKIYNLLGAEVATLLQAHKPAGRHTINFDASGLASGLYYYTLTADDPSTGSGQAFKQTRKMLLLR